ncbi:hypothetical protein XAC3824_1230005 [Xanthomonas citri pv. citri]|nr:hypothetical protein XAC3824_1230005 [Xanthomonas citri pv. citri]CEE51682.1 hypothetical protein XAC71A_1330013 [Xanthomonas citri pv. citri]CEL42880.1 hypothetical protein XAC439_12120005 [Xanthomonas citri pv. citri]
MPKPIASSTPYRQRPGNPTTPTTISRTPHERITLDQYAPFDYEQFGEQFTTCLEAQNPVAWHLPHSVASARYLR